MYKSFTLLNNWETCPQVMSYICKGAGLNTAQLQPCTSRDLIFLQIQAQNTLPLNIVNTYNAPISSTGASATVDLLTELLQALQRSALLIGNFNLHYSNQDPSHSSPFRQAKPFVAQLNNNNFAFTSKVSELT